MTLSIEPRKSVAVGSLIVVHHVSMYTVKESFLCSILCLHFIDYFHTFFMYVTERSAEVTVSPDIILSKLS